MSLAKIKQSIADGTMKCPTCKRSIKQYGKFVEMVASVWDGPGDTRTETSGSKVTLTCGNPGCDWTERTEFWDSYIV